MCQAKTLTVALHLYPFMVNGIWTIYSRGLNKWFSSKFFLGSRVRYETPEEGRKTPRQKSFESIYEDEVRIFCVINNFKLYLRNLDNYWRLNLAQVIYFPTVKWSNSSIWAIDGTLTETNTPVLSGTGNSGNEELLDNPKPPELKLTIKLFRIISWRLVGNYTSMLRAVLNEFQKQ